jgi:hypothetical protein
MFMKRDVIGPALLGKETLSRDVQCWKSTLVSWVDDRQGDLLFIILILYH